MGIPSKQNRFVFCEFTASSELKKWNVFFIDIKTNKIFTSIFLYISKYSNKWTIHCLVGLYSIQCVFYLPKTAIVHDNFFGGNNIVFLCLNNTKKSVYFHFAQQFDRLFLLPFEVLERYVKQFWGIFFE